MCPQLSPVEHELRVKWSHAASSLVSLAQWPIFGITSVIKLVLPFSLQAPSLTEKVTKEMVWDPMVGFRIPYGAYDSYNMLACHAKVNSQVFKSEYLPSRLSESVAFLVTWLLIVFNFLIV